MNAPMQKPGPLTWVRQKYLARRDQPVLPAETGDLGDELREKARDLVSGLATLTHRLVLTEDENEALRGRVRRLEAENARLGDELSAALSAGTKASTTLSKVALEIESFVPHFWRAELFQAADWAKEVVPEMLRDAGVDVADVCRAAPDETNAAVTKEGAK